jgi:hypothetical protein
MIQYLRNIFKPSCYHGQGRNPPFFEGWYFKLVDAEEKHTFAVIPGIFLAEDSANTYAFVQVLDGNANRLSFHRFSADEFSAREDIFDIRVGQNHFSTHRIRLKIDDAEAGVQGELNFANTVPWPVTLISPGIMGWYAWMPFMECYHGVVSMDHTIEGALDINGRTIDFGGGRGYIEKDWGRSFPSAWIWLQSNHLAAPGNSFSASVAIIPWIGRSFPGFIIGLWYREKLYRFATYTGAKIRKLDVNEHHIYWVVGDRRHTLEIQIERPGTAAALLHAPTINGMDRRIEERLNASVHLRLFSGKELVFEETGRHGGLEVVGDINHLVAMWEAETEQ